ncbi:hypothetical protein [Planctomicrobium piriforme]|uniref:hypothetical protein n=1 Tax=Planctomicrobium piriforme TaxID=1576369 RepID=UPI0011139DEC|nr:hypothetical protein [Planctomicrobium piriforme]
MNRHDDADPTDRTCGLPEAAAQPGRSADEGGPRSEAAMPPACSNIKNGFHIQKETWSCHTMSTW